MSIEGESYEQWRWRLASPRPVRTPSAARWDVAVIALLAVFFLWVGGASGWVGLGLVAAMRPSG